VAWSRLVYEHQSRSSGPRTTRRDICVLSILSTAFVNVTLSNDAPARRSRFYKNFTDQIPRRHATLLVKLTLDVNCISQDIAGGTPDALYTNTASHACTDVIYSFSYYHNRMS